MSPGTVSVGHPVNVATGEVYSTHRDISISGEVDLVWERRYSTALLGSAPTPLGRGWAAPYFVTLTKEAAQFRFVTPEGYTETFTDSEGKVDRGGIVRNLGTFQELARRQNQYVITRWNVETGHIDRYVFDAGVKGQPAPLHSVEDVTGQALDMLRDKTGRLTGIRQRLEKRTLLLEYTPADRILSAALLLPGGDQRVLARYEYDVAGRLIVAYDALEYPDRYEYDDQARLTKERLKDGSVFCFRYDATGRCIYTSGLEGYDEKSLRYLDAVFWTEVTDSGGHVRRFEWLPTGQVVTELDAVGGTRRTEYDATGRPVTISEPGAATTSFEYDEAGNRSVVMDPLGYRTVRTFNSNHQMLTLTDAAGGVWQSTYDVANRWVAYSDALKNRWTFEYSADGALVSVRNPRGYIRRVRYSSHGASWGASDYEGHWRTYDQDPVGRIVREVRADGEVVNFAYDARGQLVRVASESGSSVSLAYDSGGNISEIVDALGHRLKFKHDCCGRLLERTDELGQVRRFVWGTEPGHLLGIINEKGEKYSFELDGVGRIVRETGFDDVTRFFAYDSAGRCTVADDGMGKRSAYEYDRRGQLVRRTCAQEEIASFEYDHFGNVVSAASRHCKLRFERDALGHVVKEEQGDAWIKRRYDEIGNKVAVESSHGTLISYEFDGNSRLITVRAGQKGPWKIERDGMGREVVRELPNGLKLRQSYDRDGLLITQVLDRREPYGGSRDRQDVGREVDDRRKAIDRGYKYDAAGRLVARSDLRWGVTEYGYDAAERILRAWRSDGREERFEYDPAGNITLATELEPGANREEPGRSGATGPAKWVRRDYGRGNRLLQCGSRSFGYDSEGRVIQISDSSSEGSLESQLSWDCDDQLLSIARPNGARTEFKYDPLGRRIAKGTGDGEIRFLWDQDVLLNELPSGSPPITWVFVPRSFIPLAWVNGDEAYSLITDSNGVPREAVSFTGEIGWSIELRTWGTTDAATGTTGDCPLRFQGQFADGETGLFYNRYRYYDPTLGRFLSPDPLGPMSDLNEYLYAPNPLSWSDPLGLIIVYRNVKADSNPSAGLSARQPGRDMTVDGHVRNGSRSNFKGSQFLSTTTDPAVAAKWRQPNEVTVTFDTDSVVPDAKGNLRVIDISTMEKAKAAGVKGLPARFAAASKEVLVEGRVPGEEVEEVEPKPKCS